jgi:hypothetical protein
MSFFVVVLTLSSDGFAQDDPAGPQPEAAVSAPAEPAAEPDGGRFRFGINGTVGLESVSGDGASLSGAMYGLDLRLGWQINNLLAVYAQPHLSFGSLSTDTGGGELSGATGTFIGTVMAEATFVDRLFVGAGLGYGVLNNPSGLAIDIRAGGYPLMDKADDRPRRKGLMLAMDFRSVFIDGGTGVLVMGQLGYEAF